MLETDIEVAQNKQQVLDLQTKTNNIEKEICALKSRHGITSLEFEVDNHEREIRKLQNMNSYLINQEYRLDPDREAKAGDVFPSDIKDDNGNRLYKHHRVLVKVKIRDIEPYRYDGKRVDYVSMLPYIIKAVKMIDELHGHQHFYYDLHGGNFGDYRAAAGGNFWYYYSVSLFYKRTQKKCCKFSTINEIYKYEQIKFNEYID